jgi:FtsH Extracellular
MIWGMAIGGVAVVFLLQSWSNLQRTEMIPYSEFERLISAKQVSEVVIGAETIEGELKSPLPSGKAQFSTIRVDPAIADNHCLGGFQLLGTWRGQRDDLHVDASGIHLGDPSFADVRTSRTSAVPRGRRPGGPVP